MRAAAALLQAPTAVRDCASNPVPRMTKEVPASPDDRRPLADYYFVLGVPPDATETELHAAWRRQLKYWHPDRGNHPDALEHAKLINLAHDVLTNSAKRAEYDRQRAAAGWRPSVSSPTYTRPTRWRTVGHEGPRRPPNGFDRHAFVARLEEMMNRGRLMIQKRKDIASASKWEAQTQAFLHDELGEHAYTKSFEEALKQPRPEGLVAAYGVLWAAYEDALKGDLRPVPKEKRQS
jgi:curved DNA-binding protein CbpA